MTDHAFFASLPDDPDLDAHLPQTWKELLTAFRERFASRYYTTTPEKLPAYLPLPKTWKADFRWWLDDQADKAWRQECEDRSSP